MAVPPAKTSLGCIAALPFTGSSFAPIRWPRADEAVFSCAFGLTVVKRLEGKANRVGALENLIEKIRVRKKDMIICPPHSESLFALTQAEFLDKLGPENVCGDMENLRMQARQILEGKKNKKEVDRQ